MLSCDHERINRKNQVLCFTFTFELCFKANHKAKHVLDFGKLKRTSLFSSFILNYACFTTSFKFCELKITFIRYIFRVLRCIVYLKEYSYFRGPKVGLWENHWLFLRSNNVDWSLSIVWNSELTDRNFEICDTFSILVRIHL